MLNKILHIQFLFILTTVSGLQAKPISKIRQQILTQARDCLFEEGSIQENEELAILKMVRVRKSPFYVVDIRGEKSFIKPPNPIRMIYDRSHDRIFRITNNEKNAFNQVMKATRMTESSQAVQRARNFIALTQPVSNIFTPEEAGNAEESLHIAMTRNYKWHPVAYQTKNQWTALVFAEFHPHSRKVMYQLSFSPEGRLYDYRTIAFEK